MDAALGLVILGALYYLLTTRLTGLDQYRLPSYSVDEQYWLATWGNPWIRMEECLCSYKALAIWAYRLYSLYSLYSLWAHRLYSLYSLYEL